GDGDGDTGRLRVRPDVVQAESRDGELDVLDQQLVGPVAVDIGRRERRAPRVARERAQRGVGLAVTGHVARDDLDAVAERGTPDVAGLRRHPRGPVDAGGEHAGNARDIAHGETEPDVLAGRSYVGGRGDR